MDNKKEYNYMENVLQGINSKYISLAEEDVRRNNEIIKEVLPQIVDKMKEKSILFKNLFSTVFYGGSFFVGLKVGKPEEFDLDLLLKLPLYAEPTLINSNIPGFVHLQMKALDKWKKQPESANFPGIENFFDSKGYLLTTKISSWIEGVITKALNEFRNGDIETSRGTFKITKHQGGPAYTLKLRGTAVIDVDLVPCFVFGSDKWPTSPYRCNMVFSKPNFFIVPKKPHTNETHCARYWRLSFQEQENVLIGSSTNLKPALRLIKHLRDTQNDKIISSYYIKTIFLWENVTNNSLWANSLSYVFMQMLKKYQKAIENGSILYFWNKSNNLLNEINKSKPLALENISNKLKKMIDSIERHPGDPSIVQNYLESRFINADELPMHDLHVTSQEQSSCCLF